MIKNQITIDVSSSKKAINPMIYSNFIEHLGESIHNGIWTYDPVNVPLIGDKDPILTGVREDILEAVKYSGMTPPQLLADGFRQLALESSKIGNLTISPDMISELLKAGK